MNPLNYISQHFHPSPTLNGGQIGDPVQLINVTKTEYMYKYQGQERQDELGLNWDSFKWRNYDYAIGRFFNHDPLSEKYVYNSPYAFQENKMGMGRELEGLELEMFNYLKDKVSQTKESVVKTYNKTKIAVVETTNNVVKSTKEILKEGQHWVKENKEEILNVANNMQDAGDAIAITGYVAAVAGAPVAGVGSAPGATVAAVGNGLALLGSGIEIATNLIAGDNDAAGQEASFVAGGLVIDAVVDRVLPGPTPDISKEATTILKEGVNVKTIIAERVIKKEIEEKENN